RQLLAYFYKSELLNRKRLYTILLNESNNHFDVIDQLRGAGIIYEHPLSDKYAPVYILDRELMKIDFTAELMQLIGTEFKNFNKTEKQVLNLLYRYSKYNEEPV